MTTNDARSYGTEVAQAAMAVIDRPAINHKWAAGCDFGDTTDRCMEVGLTPDGFDCSGVAIHSLSIVLGLPVADWSRDKRHVRQMYDPRIAMDLAGVYPGMLAVFGAFRDVGGTSLLCPTHTGIVVAVDRLAAEIDMVHAFTYGRRVVSERVPMRVAGHERFMGFVDAATLAEQALRTRLAA